MSPTLAFCRRTRSVVQGLPSLVNSVNKIKTLSTFTNQYDTEGVLILGLDFFFPFELNLVKGFCQQRPLIGQRFFSEKTKRDIYTIGEKEFLMPNSSL